MGYELTIKKEGGISKEEWFAYIESDKNFKRIEEVSTPNPRTGAILTIKVPDAGLWEYQNKKVAFAFRENRGIYTINPDGETIEKMIMIANIFNAVVKGEEGEIYDEQYLKRNNPKKQLNSNKKRWKFWR